MRPIPYIREEIQAFATLMRINPSVLTSVEGKQGTYTPEYQVLEVRFYAGQGIKTLPFVVEIVPIDRYPHTEPIGVLVHPDIGRWIQGMHTYKNLGGRVICAHMREWSPEYTMALFFKKAIFPWTNNLIAWMATRGEWHERYWVT